jgi:N-acetylmuramoyl-L-alanine amidase
VLSGTVRTPDRPGARHLEVVRVDGVDYLDLNEVARLFRGTKYWRAELEKMVLKVEGHRVRLTVGSPYAYVDERGVNLFAPVRWHDGRIFVPVRLATDVLDLLVSESVSWDRRLQALRVDTGDPNIVALDVSPRQNGTVAELRLTSALTGELEFPRGDRVVVRVPGGVFSPGIESSRGGLGLIDSLEARQEPGVAVLTFHLGPLGGTAELLPRTSPPRLLVVFRETAEDDIPLPDYEGAPGGREVRRIVIDPGHGGSDAGVTTPAGVEKDVNLAIAQALRSRLEDAGFEVRLTRTDDSFLAADERVSRANGLRPDLFLSVHANAWFDEGMHGFTLGIPRARQSAGRDELRAWGERDRLTARDEELAADMLAEEMERLLDLPGRGVRRSDYAPLAGTTSPAVMVECGFLTNRGDARRLTDPEEQSRIAAAITSGVVAWRDQLAAGGTP